MKKLAIAVTIIGSTLLAGCSSPAPAPTSAPVAAPVEITHGVDSLRIEYRSWEDNGWTSEQDDLSIKTATGESLFYPLEGRVIDSLADGSVAPEGWEIREIPYRILTWDAHPHLMLRAVTEEMLQIGPSIHKIPLNGSVIIVAPIGEKVLLEVKEDVEDPLEDLLDIEFN